jgi:hypothetical protein
MRPLSTGYQQSPVIGAKDANGILCANQGCGSGSGINDFVDPDPWTRKMKKKMHFSLTFKTFFLAKR